MSTAIGSVVDFFSNWMTNAYNKRQTKLTNEANREIARETNAANMLMNQQNIDFQQKENEIARAREDDAIRRRANDLMGAGLSKTLAAGSAASANAMQAPQNSIAAQTGAPMQSSKATPYTGFETALNHKKQNQIADQELDLKSDQLVIEQQKADEIKRHNEAQEQHEKDVLEEERNWHKQQVIWKRAELNQSSRFHDDAMKLSWAQTRIDFLGYLNEVDKTEIQNMWYSAQAKFQEHEDEREAMRLTADLAESSAKVGMYLKDAKLSEAQIKYLQQESNYLGAMIAESIAKEKNLNAATKEALADSFSKTWNLYLSVKDRIRTTDQNVTPSMAHENALNRKNANTRAVIAGVAGLATGAFLKFGGGLFIRKEKGFDNSDWYKDL